MRWGDDLARDCAELRRLERWGIYPPGSHDRRCGVAHDENEESAVTAVDVAKVKEMYR